MDKAEDSTAPLELSENENKKLSFEHWFQRQAGQSLNPEVRKSVADFLLCCMHYIREAYISIRNSGFTHIIEVLDDENYMRAIFQIAYSTCRMKEFVTRLREMRVTLLPNDEITGADVPPEPFEKPEILDKSGKAKCIHSIQGTEEDCSSSMKFHGVLLIAVEILAQLGVLPSFSENKSKLSRYSVVDDQSDFLMRLVESGVRQLRIDIQCAESQMVETVKTNFELHEPGSEKCNLCREVADRVNTLANTLYWETCTCLNYLGFSAFQKVRELLDLNVDPITGERGFYYPKRICIPRQKKRKRLKKGNSKAEEDPEA